MKITFIGLGIMGSRMAANLLKSGVELTVFNRSEAPMIELENKGAKTSSSIQQSVKDADIVFSMLSKPEVVEAVIINDVLNAMKDGAVWVDCSTVNPSFSTIASKEAKARDIQYLEAPVAGTKPQAELAQLAFFVGGDKDLIEKVEPFLKAMGSKVLHLGEVGKGAAFKMVVNMMLGMGMLAFSESLKLGESLGLDVDMLLNVIPTLPVSASFLKMKSELIKEENFEPQFPLELLHKDLHLAMISAYEGEMPLPFTSTAKEIYAHGMKNGLGREDMAAIIKC